MSAAKPSESQQALRAWWSALGQRERRLLGGAALLLALALLWMLTLQPALRTLARAPSEIDKLDAQWQSMQALAAEARQLRALPPVTPEQAAQALAAATARLGDQGKLALQGERAVLTLKDASTAGLRDWLAEARAGARARPIEANLTRSAQGFSGTLVLGLGVAR